MTEIRLYQEGIGPLKFIEKDKYGKPTGVTVMNMVDVYLTMQEIWLAKIKG